LDKIKQNKISSTEQYNIFVTNVENRAAAVFRHSRTSELPNSSNDHFENFPGTVGLIPAIDAADVGSSGCPEYVIF
jgi:hypothetical protein